MSELSYLEKLLDGAEVEWKLLGDVSFFEIANSGRKPVKASLRVVGKTPYYGANNIQDYVDGYTHDGEYVLIAEDGSASLDNYSIQYATGKFWANNHVHVIRGNSSVNSRYLFHYLCIVNFIPFLTGGGRAKLTKGQLIEIPIPIPCPNNPEKSLAIQSEIVRILDKFTALIAELTAELTARKRQYNYYRDQLLSFEDGEVEWKALGTICQIGDGNHSSKYPKANEMIEQGIPFIRGTNMVNGTICNQDMKYISKEKHNELKKGHLKAFDVLMANRGEVGKVAYVPEGYSGSNLNSQLAWLRANPEIIINRYLFFILCSSTIQNKLSGEGGALQQLTIKNIKNIQIPVPSITVQSNIVSFLDKFDSLTNSISEGLPREIELRQKQYEYYRDLLFSFPKPEFVTN